MPSVIERIRKRPKRERKLTAFSVSLFIVLIIMAVWATTLPHRFEAATDETVATAQEATAEDEPSLIDEFRRKASLLFSDLSVPQFGAAIEYKQEETADTPISTTTLPDTATTTEREISFDELVDEFLEQGSVE